jgi:hypothetical protein
MPRGGRAATRQAASHRSTDGAYQRCTQAKRFHGNGWSRSEKVLQIPAAHWQWSVGY